MKKLLVDNDIFVVLAASGTLENWFDVIDVNSKNVYVLPSLKHMLKQGKLHKFVKDFGDDVRKRVCLEAEKYDSVQITGEAEKYIDRFIGDNIDGGESLLFASLASAPDEWMVTKDSRCLDALAKKEKKILELVAGRIYCLEQIITGLYKSRGFEFVVEKFKLVRDMDKLLSVFFSEVNCSNENQFLESICSYMRGRRKLAGNILSPDLDP